MQVPPKTGKTIESARHRIVIGVRVFIDAPVVRVITPRKTLRSINKDCGQKATPNRISAETACTLVVNI
jgi:hypothetical protein